MGRKKQEIDPICGKRLQSLLDEFGMTQVQFAEKTIYTKEYINRMVRGSVAITPDKAKEFTSKLFSGVRWEWLAGIDDYKTLDDYKVSQLKELSPFVAAEEKLWLNKLHCVQVAMKELGYDFDTLSNIAMSEEDRRDRDEFLEFFSFISVLERSDNKYLIDLFTEPVLQEIKNIYEKAIFDAYCKEFHDICNETELEQQVDVFKKRRVNSKSDDTEKWFMLENPEKWLYHENEQYLLSYQVFKGEIYGVKCEKDKTIVQFTPQERDSFINELYNVIQALIQYHITKKKGQA
ncbi:MAG: helix-turn-helix transcriptional regulator [Clostridia bacterium]|nr:helix-turn-helix transcriptional regulator [Clostridia bacterium]